MQDFLQDCMEDFRRKAKLKVAVKPADVLDLFCSKCNNTKCVNAMKGDPLAVRAATQFDRLTKPLQADPNDPKYAELAKAWEDSVRESMRLAVSAQREDWTVPSLDRFEPASSDDPFEIPITDGVARPTTPENTEVVDDAVRHLAQAQGKNAPNLPVPEGVNEAVWDRAKGLAGKKVKSEEYVRVIYDKLMRGQPPVEESDPAPEEEPPQEPAPEHPKKHPTFRPAGRGNAPSQEGMIGGGPPPPPTQPVDPWAAPPPDTTGGRKVSAGAVIKFGEDGKIADE